MLDSGGGKGRRQIPDALAGPGIDGRGRGRARASPGRSVSRSARCRRTPTRAARRATRWLPCLVTGLTAGGAVAGRLGCAWGGLDRAEEQGHGEDRWPGGAFLHDEPHSVDRFLGVIRARSAPADTALECRRRANGHARRSTRSGRRNQSGGSFAASDLVDRCVGQAKFRHPRQLASLTKADDPIESAGERRRVIFQPEKDSRRSRDRASISRPPR